MAHNLAPLTIHDIGHRARVSITTVSRVLNPATRPLVAAATRDRVLRCIARTGYAPHLAARQLRRGRTETVGVVMAHVPGVFASSYHTQVLAGIADALLETPYRFKLILLRPGPPFWERHEFQSAEGVDGLLVTHWGAFFSGLEAAARLRLPCVTINDPEPSMKVHCVCADNEHGGALAAQHLLDHGHRRLAVLAGASYSSDHRLRLQGFRSCVTRFGPAARVHVLPSDGSRAMLEANAARLLALRPRVTGVFACTDDMALGLLEALGARGVRCPRDISVMGYDDEARARTAVPPLTTVRAPIYEAARQAAWRLIGQLGAPDDAGFYYRQTMLPVELIARASVKTLRRTRHEA